MKENIFRVLQTSAAYFAGISGMGKPPVRYTIYVGMEVEEIILQSLDCAENIIEAIPVFMGLELKSSRKLMPLPNLSYWRPRPTYLTIRKKLQRSLNESWGTSVGLGAEGTPLSPDGYSTILADQSQAHR